MKGILLFLINIILIFCSDEIKKNKSFKIYKNLRYLDAPSSVITTILSTIPSTKGSGPQFVSLPSTIITSGPNLKSILTEIKSSDLISSNLKSIPSTIPKNSSEPEPEKLLLGVDNYRFEDYIIYFFAKFLIESRKNFKNEEIFTLNINNNLRFLQNSPINVTCYYEKNISTIYEYHCNRSYNGSIQSIKLNYNGKKSDYAQYSLDHIQEQKGDIISLDLINITNCIIDEDNAIINGNAGNNNIPNNTNSIMYVIIDDSKEDIPTTFIKKNDNGNYDMKLNLKKSLSTDMKNKLGLVEIDGKNKTYILSFKDGDNSNLNYKYNPSNSTSVNKAYIPKKSSGGLSAGGIVAIILPCIAALLAVLGLAFYLGKSSSGAVAKSTIPMENINMGNNTIGISSSTNVVNKYP
jgi:hypothetical protein